MEITVIICTHNPDRTRLQCTLGGLRAQTLSFARWETLLIDNASTPALTPDEFISRTPPNLRVLQEPELGLTAARRTGLRAATREFVLFVDDDNVLAPDYLEQTLAAFTRLPQVGALGGKSIPEFSTPLAANDWRREFLPLLALRDLGEREIVSGGLRPSGSDRNVYPEFAPIGAGMALRRSAANMWLSRGNGLSDRRGGDLTSGGDNEIILCVMGAGWNVAYLPSLQLTHLIPDERLEAAYLGRLNHGIQKSWMQVLAQHDASAWKPLSKTGVLLRKAKAWLTYQAWRSPCNRIRWLGACGHFEGRVR